MFLCKFRVHAKGNDNAGASFSREMRLPFVPHAGLCVKLSADSDDQPLVIGAVIYDCATLSFICVMPDDDAQDLGVVELVEYWTKRGWTIEFVPLKRD